MSKTKALSERCEQQCFAKGFVELQTVVQSFSIFDVYNEVSKRPAATACHYSCDTVHSKVRTQNRVFCAFNFVSFRETPRATPYRRKQTIPIPIQTRQATWNGLVFKCLEARSFLERDRYETSTPFISFPNPSTRPKTVCIQPF